LKRWSRSKKLTLIIPPFIYCMTFRARKGNEIASFMSGYIIEVVSGL
jgi:hypothetical protein